jgi:hypothetical protein
LHDKRLILLAILGKKGGEVLSTFRVKMNERKGENYPSFFVRQPVQRLVKDPFNVKPNPIKDNYTEKRRD